MQKREGKERDKDKLEKKFFSWIVIFFIKKGRTMKFMNLLVVLALFGGVATFAAERELKEGDVQKVAQDIYNKAIAQQLLRMSKPDVERIMRNINSRIERLRVSEDVGDAIYEAIDKLVVNIKEGLLKSPEQKEAKKEIVNFLRSPREGVATPSIITPSKTEGEGKEAQPGTSEQPQ